MWIRRQDQAISQDLDPAFRSSNLKNGAVYTSLDFPYRPIVTNAKHGSHIGPMFGQRLRRWPNIEPKWDPCLVLSGIVVDMDSSPSPSFPSLFICLEHGLYIGYPSA